MPLIATARVLLRCIESPPGSRLYWRFCLPCSIRYPNGHTRSPMPARRTENEMPLHERDRHANRRWLVYILRCSGGSLYTGITNDLPKRLKAHNAGKASRYTRSRLPVALAYIEPQKSKSTALKREAAIKKLSRPQKDRLLTTKPTRRLFKELMLH